MRRGGHKTRKAERQQENRNLEHMAKEFPNCKIGGGTSIEMESASLVDASTTQDIKQEKVRIAE